MKVHPVSIACALRASKHFLARVVDYKKVGPDRTKFICRAVDRAVQKGLVDVLTGEATKQVLEQRLIPHNNVYTWLVREGHYDPVLSQDDDRESFEKIQEFRHSWVDELAREFFNKAPSIGNHTGFPFR